MPIGFRISNGKKVPVPSQPYWNPADADTAFTFLDDNRRCQIPVNIGAVRSTVGVSDSYGRYIELSGTENSGNTIWRFGVATSDGAAQDYAPGNSGFESWVLRGSDGDYLYNGTTVAETWQALFGQPSVTFMMAYKNGSVWFGENGSWDGDPAAGTGAAHTGILSPTYIIFGIGGSSGGGTRGVTFSIVSSYVYTPPAGFLVGW